MPTVQLSWTDNSSKEDGFRIYRTTTNSPSFPGDYTEIDTTGANTTTYDDTSPPSGQTVYYAVTAFNTDGESSETTDNIDTPIIRSAASVGAVGASTATRVANYTRASATQGAAGASTSTRTIIRNRTAATVGGAGASAVSRTLIRNRAAVSGGDAGASTVSRAYPNWALAPADPTIPTQLPIRNDASVSPQTTSLALTADRTLADKLDQFGQTGYVETVGGFGGSFRALSRGSDGPITLEPPGEYRPPFVQHDVLVAGYDETQIAPDRVEIGFEFQRVTNRNTEYSTLSQTGAYELALAESGTVGLDSEDVGHIDTSRTSDGREVSVPLLVSDKQAAALLDSLGYPDGIVERVVPDGEDTVVDESGRQSITITTPDGAQLQGGDWLCRDWSLEWYSHGNDHTWQIELTLIRA